MIKSFDSLKDFRVRDGPLKSLESHGRSGAFNFLVDGIPVGIIVVADAGDDDELGWERISITVQTMRRMKGKKKRQVVDRPPSYHEVLQIKDVFWPPEEEVIQVFGKGIGDPRCLTIELWRKKDGKMTIPHNSIPATKLGKETDDEHGSDKGNVGATASTASTDKVGGDRSGEALSGEEEQVSEHSSDSDTG